jgi:hypothetical protein
LALVLEEEPEFDNIEPIVFSRTNSNKRYIQLRTLLGHYNHQTRLRLVVTNVPHSVTSDSRPYTGQSTDQASDVRSLGDTGISQFRETVFYNIAHRPANTVRATAALSPVCGIWFLKSTISRPRAPIFSTWGFHSSHTDRTVSVDRKVPGERFHRTKKKAHNSLPASASHAHLHFESHFEVHTY